MAPRFTQRMFQTYKSNKGSEALIGFPFSEIELIFQFRDSLSKKICELNNLSSHKSEGEPTAADSYLIFYSKKHEEVVKSFFLRKTPNIFSFKKKIEYQAERLKINNLAKVRIETSHDFPCIIVDSSIHSEDNISETIDEVSKELNIEMQKNNKLAPIRNVVMSNKSFSL